MRQRLRPFPLVPMPTLSESCSAAAEQLFYDVCMFHDIGIEQEGGLPGFRDENSVRAACARPFAVFGDELRYPDGLEQAGALLQSLAGHGFNDGNKRTAFTATLYFLMCCGFWTDVGVLSQWEIDVTKELVLIAAQERQLREQGKLTAALTPASIGEALADILKASRSRPAVRRARLRTGEFTYILSLLPSMNASDEQKQGG